ILIAGAACITLAFLAPAAKRSGAGAPGAVEHSPKANPVLRVSSRGAAYFGAGNGIIFLGDGFTSGDAYRFTRSLWAEGVRSAGRCVVSPSYLRRNHGLFYLIRRIRVDEVLCSRYLLLGDADLSAHLEAQVGRVRAASEGDLFWDGRWRLEITGPPFPPPRRGAVAGSDAGLTWRLIDGKITSLDLPSRRGYHAVP
ncbi:MAG: hypothetical protein NTW97_01150, partial [Candidatus Krumholzibacteria bacterium]|nr:hypothetical protein [Candidatus Krumholzibacteria bacterium]